MGFPIVKKKPEGYLIFIDGVRFYDHFMTKREAKRTKRFMQGVLPQSEVRIFAHHNLEGGN